MDSLDVKNGVAYLHPEDGSSPAYAEGNWAAEYARKLMDAEETARENMDKTLQGQIADAIAAEKQAREATDGELQGKIDAEEKRAKTEEKRLAGIIGDETSTRMEIDEALRKQITDTVATEKTAREAADGTLEFEVCKADNLTDAINAETRIRKEEIGDLAFLIGTQNVTRAINAEYLARNAEDERLQGQIDSEIASRKRAIAEKTAAREAADKSLQTQITAEKQVRESTDRYNKLKNLADYEVTYYEYEANRFAMIVNSKQNFNDTPLGLYILSPAQDVDLIFVETTDGYNTQVYSGELRKGNTYIIDFQLEGRKLIHTIKAGGLKNFADYDVEYLEQSAYSYDLYVYTNNTIDNFPYGQYIFSPALDVGNVVIYTKNGDVIQSYNNNLFAGNTYIIDFQLEGRKLIHTIKSQEDSGSLGGVTGGSSSEELKWQLLNGKDGETLAENVKTYTYTLPEKCKGIIVDISVPKALDFNASTFNIKEASTSHWHMDQGYTWGKTGATQYNKVLRVYCKPENGYYNTTYADNSGSHPNILAQRWTGATPENKRIDTLYLGIFELTSSSEFAIPAGTIIKVWGLIEE